MSEQRLFQENKAVWRWLVRILVAASLEHSVAASQFLALSQRWLGEAGKLEATEKACVIAQKDTTNRVFSLRVSGVIASTVECDAQTVTRLFIPDVGISQQSGQPERPVYRKLLFCDGHAKLTCNASVASTRELSPRPVVQGRGGVGLSCFWP